MKPNISAPLLASNGIQLQPLPDQKVAETESFIPSIETKLISTIHSIGKTGRTCQAALELGVEFLLQLDRL